MVDMDIQRFLAFRQKKRIKIWPHSNFLPALEDQSQQ
jgi:hypothetical protein